MKADNVVKQHLIPILEPVTNQIHKNRKLNEITLSKGVDDSDLEVDLITTTEGVQRTQHMNTRKASRDLSKMLLKTRNIPNKKNRNRRSNSYVLDPTKRTERTHQQQRISKRKRSPSSKVQNALTALHKTAKRISKGQYTRQKKVTDSLFTHYAHISCLVGDQMNDQHPLAFAAGGQGSNPNILNHRDAMRAMDKNMFNESMEEEMNNLTNKEIYEIVKRTSVPEGHNILRAVWSHRRKTKPDGTIYRHRSRICADGSKQTYGMDYTET